ncbi:MAG TPA: SMC-Scp complex subunit ScpB [Alphaproteobacteria bacterium]|nr:SMC-Scp complex subunit ScpB [Alphaproteobacteria bacterium]USO05804.1 MAG: SMC-Scp complex subunit ScpB [Rhodospirillales bacterium]HOO82190.1 SMC-Scp complex subunit ScpB [Alphaproteobacteria bacterium]
MIAMDELTRIVEALLFASAEPLATADLHEYTPDGADVGAALMSLKRDYEGRGVNLVEIDGKWAFRTSADLAEALAIEKEVSKKLSRAALETLAIIAYHQPVTRAEVENIRGVATHRGTLDALIEAGWVKPGRRRETPGRPLTWVTTNAFLDQFSLESVMDLPGLDDLKASGLLDRRPAIEAIPGSDDLFAGQEALSRVEQDADEPGEIEREALEKAEADYEQERAEEELEEI